MHAILNFRDHIFLLQIHWVQQIASFRMNNDKQVKQTLRLNGNFEMRF